jgi:spore coat protein H
VGLLLAGVSAFAASEAARIDPSERFFATNNVVRLSIRLETEAQRSLQQTSRRYAKATIVEGDSVYQDVGLHLKGNYTFQFLDQKPCLTLNFDKFVSSQKFHGVDKLHLNNSLQDPTFLNEFIGGELFRAAGIPAPRVTHARLSLNGRDLGLYVLVEGFDKTFLRRYFSDPSGNCYDGGEKTDVMDPLKRTSGDGPADGSDLKALAGAAQSPASNRLERLQALMDLDRFHSFLALETLLCHWDGYAAGRNNYRLYHDPTTGRFVFLPHGMDQLFGRPQGSLLPDCAGVVARAVLSTPAGRQRHQERCAELFTNLISLARLTNHVNALKQRIRPELAELGAREVRKHDQAVERLHRQLTARIQFLETQLPATPLQLLAFDARSEASLTAWTPHVDGGEAHLTEVQEPTPALQIHNVGVHIPFVASWRTRVLLPAGHYRFEARISASDFMPTQNAPGGGICLRIYGQPPSRSEPLAQTLDWKPFSADFSVVEPRQEVALICEVRAFKGTVRIEKNSLKLVRMKRP